jgi:hypothetical protein
LTGEEAVGVGYWRARHDESDPNRSKLEFFALVQDQEVRTSLNSWALNRFDKLYSDNKDAILALSPGKRTDVERLAGGQDKPIPSTFVFKTVIEVRRGDVAEKKHIYSDQNAEFRPPKNLNGWERAILEADEAKPGFIGWFRNPEQGDDRLAIPYKDIKGTWRTKAPDFVVFHKIGSKIACSILEPHDINDPNSGCIAQGFADFAQQHSGLFERIELSIEQNGHIKRLDMAKPSWRAKVISINTNAALQAVFAQIA